MFNDDDLELNSNQTYFNLVIGTTGTGKTTFCKETIKDYLSEYDNDYKIVVIDPQGTFPIHPNKRIIKPKIDIRKDQIGGKNTWDYLDSIYNSLIVIDDTRIIFQDWGGKDIYQLGINRRHHNNDLIMIFHSLNAVQRLVYTVVNYVYLFRINENWDTVRNKVPSQITEKIFDRANKLEKFQKLELEIVAP